MIRFTRFFSLMLMGSLHEKSETGVILLHGLCRSSASMKPLERFLTQQGFTVLNVDYASRSQPVQEIADSVIPAALQSPRLKGCTRIHFVTHSLGGLVVRSYFSRNQPGKLGRVVMLAPPNQGSEVVDQLKEWWLFKWLNGPAGAELGTESDSTPNALGAVNFELGVIAGDRSVNWINSCWIKGVDDGKISVEKTKVLGMKEHRVVHSSHPLILKNRAVMADTAAFLKTGTFLH